MTRIAALAAALLASVPAGAVTTAADYNLFVLGDMTMVGSDTEGAVAVGGNAVLKPYTVGANPRGGNTDLVVRGNADIQYGSTAGRIVIGGNARIDGFGVQQRLAVGGDLSFTNGSINGGYTVGGTATVPGWMAQPVKAAAVLPVDFDAEAIRLSRLTASLKGYAATGTVKVTDWSGNGSSIELDLIGSNAGLNVFQLTSDQLGAFNTFRLNLTPGATALINVSGSAVRFPSAGMSYTGANANSVLFNFADASSVSVAGISVLGSILAPGAAFTGMGGTVNGQVIVGSFGQSYAWGGTQINSYWYAGDLLRRTVADPVVTPDPTQLPPPSGGPSPAVPEPATWATMMLGFALVGAAARRRRSARHRVGDA